MSEEIDLQLYLRALRRRWWIVAVFVAAALAIALAISVAQPKHYEAVATLTATAPRLQWRFDQSIQPIIDSRRDYQREFQAISESNDIAVEAARLLATSDELATLTPAQILAMVSVRTGDANTLVLTATADKPQQAAELANAYAQAFVSKGQQLAGASTDLANYRSELDIATQRMDQAEAALTEVRRSTGFLLVSGNDPNDIEIQNPAMRQLDLKSASLAETRNDLDSVRTLISKLETAQPGDDLAELPWELLGGPVLSRRTVVSPTWAIRSLEDPQAILAGLRTEESALASTAEQLDAEAEALRRQVAEDWQRYSTATRNFAQARDIQTILVRKVSEAEVQERIDPAQLALVSAALEPTRPTQTRQVALFLVAGVVGLILGTIVALWSGLRDPAVRQPHTLPTQG